jgi:hypothetical protein
MLQFIDNKKVLKELNKYELEDYWGNYFEFEKDEILSSITRNLFLIHLDSVRNSNKPYIDSSVLINGILTNLGKTHNFHRQFSENHSNLVREQVLGMQLYKIIIEDKDIWYFSKVKKNEHKYANAVYFK